MRVVLGVILLVLCVILGCVLASKYTRRRVFYNSFYEFNNILSNEVYFSQSTILQTLKKYEKSDDFTIIIKEYFNENKLNFDAKYLSNDEKEYFINYLKNVGSGDKRSQEKFLENVCEQIEKKLNAAKDEEKKYRSLYIKLGFLLGLIALIICI